MMMVCVCVCVFFSFEGHVRVAKGDARDGV